ncbi:MAG: hypothetical protein IPK87_13265 [Planctomycetes bacterium]|nr:hypothetical protein [Planctomycetota bacterium]
MRLWMVCIALALLPLVAADTRCVAQDAPAFEVVSADGKPIRDITARSVAAAGIYFVRGKGEAQTLWWVGKDGAKPVTLADGKTAVKDFELWDFHAADTWYWPGQALPGAWINLRTALGASVYSLSGGIAKPVRLPDGGVLKDVRSKGASEFTCAVLLKDANHEASVYRLKGDSAELVSLDAKYRRGATKLVVAGECVVLHTHEIRAKDTDTRRVLVARKDAFAAVNDSAGAPVPFEPTAMDASMRYPVLQLEGDRLCVFGESDKVVSLPSGTQARQAMLREGVLYVDLQLSAARRRIMRLEGDEFVEVREEGATKPAEISESLFVGERMLSCGRGKCWETLPDGKRREFDLGEESGPWLQHAAIGAVSVVVGFLYMEPVVLELKGEALTQLDVPLEPGAKNLLCAVTGEAVYVLQSADKENWWMLRYPLG